MAIYNNTLDALVELTFKLCLGGWFEGDCDAGSTTTVVDATRYEEDDYFQNIGAWAYIRTTTDDAAPKGEERQITDWVQSSGTATVAPALSAGTGLNDTYAFYTGWRWGAVKAAINAAIDLFAPHALVEKIDHSIQLQSSVYEYSLPDGKFMYIYRVSKADGSGDYPDPIPPDQYKIIRGYTPPRLHFYRFPEEGQHTGHYWSSLFGDDYITDNRVLRIEGLGKQENLTKDSDVCRLNPNLVAFQAAALLHAGKIMRSDVDPDEHRVQMAVWQSMADSISGGAPLYRALKPQLPPNSKRVEV